MGDVAPSAKVDGVAPFGLATSLLWPGMDPQPFFSPALPSSPQARAWIRAASNTLVGAALLYAAARLSSGGQNLWIGWLGMLGIILFLHFGTFELLAAGWNKAGVGVKPVMRAPIRATSLVGILGAEVEYSIQ